MAQNKQGKWKLNLNAPQQEMHELHQHHQVNLILVYKSKIKNDNSLKIK